jgi:hypothetical protein
MNIKDLKVVFAGCARDCATFLPDTINNIRSYSKLFKESHTVIVENGSKDKTKEILNQNLNENDLFLFREDLTKLPVRGQRLEAARNLIVETIKENEKLKNCDLFIMMDLDDMGTYQINDQDILKAVTFLFSDNKNGAVFANQLGTYYDIWTLRDQKYCKTDFWADVMKFLIKNKNSSDQISREVLIEAKKRILDKKIFSFDPSMSPILVESAFGGFGIYKMKNVLNNVNKYKGTQSIKVISKDEKKTQLKYQKCEHVNFNQGLVEQNLNLYILPYLLNRGYEKQFFRPEIAIHFIIKD